MRESVGVNSFRDFISPVLLKREALMFQRIAIPFWRTVIERFKQSLDEPPDLIKELEWLYEQEIVFEPEEILSDERILSDEEYKLYENLEDEILKKLEPLRSELRFLDQDLMMVEKDVPSGDLVYKLLVDKKNYLEANIKELWSKAGDMEKRRLCVSLRKWRNIDAIPLASNTLPLNIERQSSRSDVIQVVLNALPIPDESTSWEQIIEYRNDPDSQDKFFDLRHWISEIVRENLSPIELEQKLEYLVRQYERHMKLHRMKTNAGTLEAVIVSGAEILEDLIHLKFSKAAKALFSVKHRQIALMEGELTSPGSEIAYVVKAKEIFS